MNGASATSPVFLLSLPRSGSTWLQRVLSCHPDVITTSESWILLPVLAGARKDMIRARYGQRLCYSAMRDALRPADDAGEDDWKQAYFEGARAFGQTLYQRLGQGHRYYLDKCPRYVFITDEIAQAFPDAKYIVIWRHPAAVAASIQKTWGNGAFRANHWEMDLHDGIKALQKFSQRQDLDLCCVNYETLLAKPQETLEQVGGHLDLTLDEQLLQEAIENKIPGRMGDPNRFSQSSVASEFSLEDTVAEFCENRFRRQWLLRYLQNLGGETLAHMGYDLPQAERVIRATKVRGLGLMDSISAKTYAVRRPLIRLLTRRTSNFEQLFFDEQPS